MKDRNTKGKIEFIVDHVLWASAVWFCYKNILFRCLEHCSLTDSRLILLGLVIACCGVGILLDFRKRRNDISLMINLLTGFGLYTVLTYYPIKRSLILISILAAAVLAAVYSVLILCRKIKNKEKWRKILLRRATRALNGSRKLICVGLASVILLIGGNAVFGTALITPSVAPEIQSAINVDPIDSNLDTLLSLQEENWKTLSSEEKLNVLQTIANIETCFLGLPHELNVGASNLQGEQAGYYSDSNHKIIVSMDYLLNGSSYELTNIIAHEAYHSLQHRMVDALDEVSDELKTLKLFYDAFIYKEEFADYTEGSKDYYEYYAQKCEADARQYAKDAANRYFERIERYRKRAS